MTRKPSNPKRLISSSRAGVTISEVLISMVIMAIGVVSLATLFPASVLRSIQASQLTNSALLLKNAKARLFFDTNLLSKKHIPTSKSIAMIDPFGTIIDTSTNQPKYNLDPTIAGQAGGIVRYSVDDTGNTQQSAEGLAMLPDSWSLVRQDGIIVDPRNIIAGGYAVSARQLTMASSGDNFSNIFPRTTTAQGNPLYRITILDATGRKAATRFITQVDGNQLGWGDANSPPDSPPDEFPFIPARGRVEVRDNRYTWMLTLRKSPGNNTRQGDADLVVFFNRSFKATDEVLITTIRPTQSNTGGFDGKAGVAGVDDNLDGFVDNFTDNIRSGEENWPGSDDLRTLSYTGSLPPFFKKGSYLLETSQALWYRVVNINTKNNLILLDRDFVSPSANGPFNFVAFKGITQVFELGRIPVYR